MPGSDVARERGDSAGEAGENGGDDPAGEDANGGEQGEQVAGRNGEQESASGGETDETGTAAGTGQEDGGAGQEDDRAGGELARALEDLDGEILAERIKAEPAARTVADRDDGQAGGESDGAGATQSGGGAMPGRRTIASATPATPRPPLPTPPDTPDARDDCVVARQIREAAMNETDPELRDALWKEYERYESCQ